MIKNALASFYSQTKRKKNLKRKKLSDDDSNHDPKEPVHSTRPPPPPPTGFRNLFRKGSKSKRIHSFSASPPPPPPPPPQRSSKPKSQTRTPQTPPPPPPPLQRSSKPKSQTRTPQTPPPPPPLHRSSKPKSQTRTPSPPPNAQQRRPPESSFRQLASTAGRPPLPKRTDQFYNETVDNRGHSPSIPTPPPPPPFEMPKTKFVIRGDFFSARTSSCSSPEMDDLDTSSSEGNLDPVDTMEGGDRAMGSAFCLRPDVNVEAETFIAGQRGGWRREKMNSVKENRNLDPGPGPGPSMLS